MAMAMDIEHAKAWIAMNPERWDKVCDGACIPLLFQRNTYFINLVRNERFLRSKKREQGFPVRNPMEEIRNEFGPFNQPNPDALDSRTCRYVPELLRPDQDSARNGNGGGFGGAGATGSWETTDSGGEGGSSADTGSEP